MRRRPDAAIGNVIWLIMAGIWLAISHLISGIALCITITALPREAELGGGPPIFVTGQYDAAPIIP